MLDTVKLRRHAERSKAEGIRDAGAEPEGDMAEAKRHLTACANEFGLFVDPIDDAARESVEGKVAAE